MRQSTLLAVGVFILLCGATAWVLTRAPERGISRLAFANVDPNRVDGIVIEGPMPLQARKVGDVWKLANGRDADADAVRNLLASTARMRSSDLLTQDASRAEEFETQADKGHHVTLTAGSERVADFVVGKSLAGGTAVRQGDATYKVSGVYPAAFAHAANEWLQRRLFTDHADAIARLHVQLQEAPPYTLVSKEGAWRLLTEDETKPSDFRFDAGLAATQVSSLLDLRAQDILPADPGPAVTGLDKPSAVLTWYLKEASPQDANGASRTLRLGGKKEDGSIYAKVDGSSDWLTLPTYAVTSFAKPLESLRDLSLTAPVDASKVNALIVDDGKSRLTLKKDSTGKWSADQSAPGFELDPAKVTRRIAAVVHARAQALLADQAAALAGLKASRARVTLRLEDNSSVELLFGKSTGAGRVAVRGTADSRAYETTEAQRDNLLAGLQSFKLEAQMDPLAQLDEKTLQGLPPEVRASLQGQIAQKKREQEMIRRLQSQAAR